MGVSLGREILCEQIHGTNEAMICQAARRAYDKKLCFSERTSLNKHVEFVAMRALNQRVEEMYKAGIVNQPTFFQPSLVSDCMELRRDKINGFMEIFSALSVKKRELVLCYIENKANESLNKLFLKIAEGKFLTAEQKIAKKKAKTVDFRNLLYNSSGNQVVD